jgi:protein-S-isoprenylcysteine O-methyltransferase Ste14
VIGLASGASGVMAFRRHRTTTNPIRIDAASSLVTGGVYRLTRNPMYLGLALLLSAWAAYLGTPWALLGPLGLVVFLTRFQIIPEERVMLGKFGAAYDAYRRRVRRWI